MSGKQNRRKVPRLAGQNTLYNCTHCSEEKLWSTLNSISQQNMIVGRQFTKRWMQGKDKKETKTIVQG